MNNPHTLSKVAECLYRNGHGTYFALLMVRGKQIKRTLKPYWMCCQEELWETLLSKLRSEVQELG